VYAFVITFFGRLYTSKNVVVVVLLLLERKEKK